MSDAKILGITAEYNPLHNGHIYHLQKSGEIIGADYTVAALSGNFTQRGEPAMFDKYVRSKWAVRSGVDIVAELPFIFSCSRAEIYAAGAVDLLAGMGATHISFGCETSDFQKLRELSERRSPETEQGSKISEMIPSIMKEGFSYAKAGEIAARRVLGDEYADVMLSPNNILALEYLKRINYWKKRGRNIEPVPVKRTGSGYNDVNEKTGYSGASQIRRMLSERTSESTAVHSHKNEPACSEKDKYPTVRDTALYKDFAEYISGNQIREQDETCGYDTALSYRQARPYIPGYVYDDIIRIMGDEPGNIIAQRDLWLFEMVRYEIIRSSTGQLSSIYCIGEGIENLMKKAAIKAADLQEFMDIMVSKRYTAAAIKRMIIYIITGISKDEAAGRKSPEYIRILAASPKGRELIRRSKKENIFSLPVITNVNKENTEITMQDIKATDIYNLITGRNLYKYSDRVIKPFMG